MDDLSCIRGNKEMPELQEHFDYNLYLPPYRSMINPDRCYDYRSHRYVNASNDRGSETGQSPQSSRISRYITTPLNNTRQKIMDAASDTLSIRSLRGRCGKQTTIYDLPNEILLQIFSLLKEDTPSIVMLLYVDKRINDLAKIILYEEPQITTTFRLAQFVQTINTSKKLAMLVKHLDLSQMTIGIDLTDEERQEFASSIVFGLCDGTEIGELLDRQWRPIYAGWRDFRYRFDPLYGDLASHVNCSTSFVQPDSHVFKRNPIYYASALKNDTLQTALHPLESVQSLYPQYNFIGSTRKRHRPLEVDSSSDSDARSLSRSTSYSFEEEKELGLFNSLRMFLHVTVSKVSHRQRKSKDVANEPTTDPPSKKNTQTDSAANGLYQPYGTPHPQQSQYLRQYCLSKDIPIGYLLHLVKECENLERLNLSGVSWSYDFLLGDYEYFNWQSSTGQTKPIRAYQQEYHSMLPMENQDRSASFSQYKVDKPIYWSDTMREVDFKDPELQTLTITSVWPLILKLKKLTVLEVRNCVWLNKPTLRKLVMNSHFRKRLVMIDCTNSGLSKRSQWAACRTAREWRHFFRDEARQSSTS